MKPGTFQIDASDAASRARTACLHTAHGPVETPTFMPVGTHATVKAMDPAELEALGISIILSNTYHLNERPGADLIAGLGGLHRFMGWSGAILTDSGGFQVFSLSDCRQIRPDGVLFRSAVDGRERFIGPVEAMAIQRQLGSDIAMVFDECPPYPCEREYACQAVERTLAWAASCAAQPRADGQLVFGIVQGGIWPDLRADCARDLQTLGFDGYAIGGVSVGEPEELIRRGVNDTVAHLPAHQPRYLMGVGLLTQVLDAVAAGVDMFDCVMPTRCARNGSAFTRSGRLPVKAGRFRDDPRPVEEGCECPVCTRFSRAYIRHLLNVDEILGVKLLTLHNLFFYETVMREARNAIRQGEFSAYREKFQEAYNETSAGVRAKL